jgi:hypothetical protein
MRQTRILLPMIFWAALGHGASIWSQSSRGPGQASSQAATPETADHGNENGRVTAEKDEARSDLDRNQTGPTVKARSSAKLHSVTSRAKPVSHLQVRSANTAPNGSLSAPNTSADNSELRQNGSSMSTDIPHKTANPHSVPIPLTADSVNGQQFKNARDPGARMATSGGAANSMRGTAVINGSDIKRKP